MRNIAAAIGVVLFLSACNHYSGYGASRPAHTDLRQSSLDLVASIASATAQVYAKHGEGETVDAALEAVRRQLKDPESARFRDVRLVEYQGGRVVCGEVNAKNSYGGYVGHKPFAAGPGMAVIYSTSRYASIERAANAGLDAACYDASGRPKPAAPKATSL